MTDEIPCLCGFNQLYLKEIERLVKQEFEAAKMLGSSAPGHNSVDSLDTVDRYSSKLDQMVPYILF